jgi:hypothetical protein
MTDYEAYKTYCALKRHFQSPTYDYFKYNGKVKASYATFEKRPDRFFFTKLAKHKDIIGFLVANFAIEDKWVGDLVNEQLAEKAYKDWLKRKESLSYVFKGDIGKIDGLIDSLKVIDNQHPILLKMYLSKEISAETLIIINHIQRYFGYWSKNMKNDPIWNEQKNKLLKLTPFVEYNDKYKQILIERFRHATN